MRKFLLGTAIAASALTAVASPAAAQYYPQQQQGYGYNQGYNQGYGNNQNYGYQNRGDGRMLIARVDQVRQQIRILDRRNALSNQEARGLDREALQLRYQVQRLAYNGVDRRERFNVEQRIVRLEQRVSYNANDRDNYYNRGNAYGQQGNWQNRDSNWNDRDHRDRDDD